MLHSWEVLAEIIDSDIAQDIVCDVGMYVFASASPSRATLAELTRLLFCAAIGR